MKIYRIENEDGIGPFAKAYFETTEHKDFYNGYFWPLLNSYYQKNHLPNLEEDELVIHQGLTGCKTIEDLSFWFPKDLLVALDGMGFTAVEYEVPNEGVVIGKSDKQLSFNEDKAEFIKEFDLETLCVEKVKKSRKMRLSVI